MTWKSFWHDLWRGLSDTKDSETGSAASGGAADNPTPDPTPPPPTPGASVQGIENANNTFDTNSMGQMGQTTYSQLNAPHW